MVNSVHGTFTLSCDRWDGLLSGISEIEIEIIHNNTGKLDRLLSIGSLYLAIHDF
jgi:hypothetical protein